MAYLVARGLRLEARNLRIGRSEIDLVMRDGPQTVFVEVKTCRPGDLAPIEGIGRRKILALRRAIGRYLCAHPEVASVRVDVVTVLRRGVRWEIEWMWAVL